MNTNEKGVRGQIKVLEDLQLKGFYTFLPFDDHSPIDLVAADRNGRCYRLQVKYREQERRSKRIVYGICAQSIVNGKRVNIDLDLIDGWAVYLAGLDRVVYISKFQLGNKNSYNIYEETPQGDLGEWIKPPTC